jgi:hypothetical protein
VVEGLVGRGHGAWTMVLSAVRQRTQGCAA